jgi:hypothetical protein
MITRRKRFAAVATLASAACVLAAVEAHAADYVSIVQDVTVNAPAEAVWKKAGGFCDIGAWLKTSCTITAGTDRELGAVRLIAGRVTEVLVAKTATSYSYADPNQPILYHGTVEVRPIDKGHSKIVYTLFFDQAAVKPEDQAANRERRAKMFAGVLQTMKAAAEAK